MSIIQDFIKKYQNNEIDINQLQEMIDNHILNMKNDLLKIKIAVQKYDIINEARREYKIKCDKVLKEILKKYNITEKDFNYE